MVQTRYKKLAGMHAGHVYRVVEPASEVDSPLRWVLHGEDHVDEKLIVAEDELADKAKWQELP